MTKTQFHKKYNKTNMLTGAHLLYSIENPTLVFWHNYNNCYIELRLQEWLDPSLFKCIVIEHGNDKNEIGRQYLYYFSAQDFYLKENVLEEGKNCECGSKHTSFKNYHSQWCPEFKKTI